MSDTNPIRLEVRVSALPPDGDTYQIRAGADERAALADFLDLVEVSEFQAEIALKPAGKGIVDLHGKIGAAYLQNCVVTLEPVHQTLSETFQLRLAPEDSAEPAGAPPSVEVDPEAADPPDRYAGAYIDVGAIAVEHFALAIDPYPRAPGAAFPDQGIGDDPAAIAGPFAELARLKDRSGGAR